MGPLSHSVGIRCPDHQEKKPRCPEARMKIKKAGVTANDLPRKESQRPHTTRCFRHPKSGDQGASNQVDSWPPLLMPNQSANSTDITKTINTMLYTIAVILLALWLLGFVSSYTMGGFIHILLVIAIVVILVRIIQGRNVL
jgi:hypothetical protein